MANYVKTTNFAAKDSLLSGNPLKLVRGTEIDTEFTNISTAIATKADSASPAFSGTPTAPTAAGGTNSTQIATTAFTTAAVNAVYSGTNTFLGLHNFRDTSFRLQDNSDITKFANFELSGISTNTTRTYTLPNLNGTLALTSDIPVNDILTNTSVSGSYAVTTSAIIRITATHNFSVGQEVQLTFTNTSGAGLVSGAYVITAISGTAWFEVNYGSNVTSAGTVTAERYGLVAFANNADMAAGVTQLKAITPKQYFDNKLILMTQQTPTGVASITFPDIPSWVKRITVTMAGISNATGGTVSILVGTSAGTVTTGYSGTGGFVESTASISISNNTASLMAFGLANNSAVMAAGTFVLTKLTGNTWVGSGTYSRVETNARVGVTNGTIALASVLDRIVITSESNFDAGTINVMYE